MWNDRKNIRRNTIDVTQVEKKKKLLLRSSSVRGHAENEYLSNGKNDRNITTDDGFLMIHNTYIFLLLEK